MSDANKAIAVVRDRPDFSNPLMRPFWEASRRHELAAQRCRSCGDIRFPPLALCPKCWSEDQEWIGIEPFGTLWSFVIYRRAMHPAFAKDVPYAIGRVKTHAGPIFETRLAIALEDIRMDMPVVACFQDIDEEYSLLHFKER